MSEMSTGRHHGAGRYEIRLKGHLDARWAAWFDGLSLTNEQRRHHRHFWPGPRPGRPARSAPEGARHRPAAGLGQQIDPDQPGVPTIAPR